MRQAGRPARLRPRGERARPRVERFTPARDGLRAPAAGGSPHGPHDERAWTPCSSGASSRSPRGRWPTTRASCSGPARAGPSRRSPRRSCRAGSWRHGAAGSRGARADAGGSGRGRRPPAAREALAPCAPAEHRAPRPPATKAEREQVGGEAPTTTSPITPAGALPSSSPSWAGRAHAVERPPVCTGPPPRARLAVSAGGGGATLSASSRSRAAAACTAASAHCRAAAAARAARARPGTAGRAARASAS